MAGFGCPSLAGFGCPLTAGAAIACPDRPVIDLQADGSALYTLQALWTEARETLNVTTLICSNRSYNILRMELDRVGITSVGPKVSSLTDLEHPAINWVKLAEAMGVSAAAVSTVEGLVYECRRALSEPGPHLIEMMLTSYFTSSSISRYLNPRYIRRILPFRGA